MQQIHRLCEAAGFSPNVVQQAEEWYTVLGFVRAGFGITIALDIFGALVWPDVEVRAIADTDASSPIYLCWDEERPLPARDLLINWVLHEAAIPSLAGA